MRLLFIVDDYLPHSIKVAAKMMHELALEFQKKGHQVIVLTPLCSPYEKPPITELDGVNILFFKSGELKNIGKTKRAINESLLSLKARKTAINHMKNNTCDGIVYYSPSIFWGPLVKQLKKLSNCKSYLILRDIFPQWTVDNGLMKENSLIHKYFMFFEKINYRNADKIGVMSPSNLELFKSRMVNISKFEVLFNWASLENVSRAGQVYRKKLGLENKTVFFYGGNIGHAQQMMNLINLARKFNTNKTIHFLFVGKGDEVDLILKEKEKHKLDNISYLPSVDQTTYFRMLNEFDIGMFSLHPDHKTHNFPGKLLGYMACSKPIIGCVNSGNDLKKIVNDSKAGIITDSMDENGLYEAAISLVKSESLRKDMGKNGRNLLATRFSVESAALQIEKALLG